MCQVGTWLRWTLPQGMEPIVKLLDLPKANKKAEPPKPGTAQEPSTARFSPEGRLLRLPDVRRIVPVSRSTIYRWVEEGKFPAPKRPPDSRTIFWEEAEVLAWKNAM